MATSPQGLLVTNVDRAEAAIDALLKDPRNYQKTSLSCISLDTASLKLSNEEQRQVEQRYHDAGWHTVMFAYSGATFRLWKDKPV